MEPDVEYGFHRVNMRLPSLCARVRAAVAVDSGAVGVGVKLNTLHMLRSHVRYLAGSFMTRVVRARQYVLERDFQ